MSDARWKVTLVYRTDYGDVDVEHLVEELEEIPALVERGPNWNCLIEGRFMLNRVSEPGLTVEGAEKL